MNEIIKSSPPSYSGKYSFEDIKPGYARVYPYKSKDKNMQKTEQQRIRSCAGMYAARNGIKLLIRVERDSITNKPYGVKVYNVKVK